MCVHSLKAAGYFHGYVLLMCSSGEDQSGGKRVSDGVRKHKSYHDLCVHINLFGSILLNSGVAQNMHMVMARN